MAYTERGIFYQTDYNEDADILEDMEHMAKSTDDAIGNLSEDVSTSLINIFGIEVYEPTKTYAIGNMVIYDSKIYRCTAITTGEFDDTKWEEVSIRELIDEKYFKPNGGIPENDLAIEIKNILDNAEDNNNKVNELTEASTNEQYPSAKAVYDENLKLKTQVNTLKEITSQMPQVSDSGEEAYLADTIKAPFTEFEVKGHSEQETTEGRQLFNVTDYTNLVIGNNGNATNVKTSNKITITTGDNSVSSGVYITKANLINYIKDYDSTQSYYVSMDIKSNRNITLQMGCDNRPTMQISATQNRISVQTLISANGLIIYSTENTADDTIEVSNIMISTDSNTVYEKYTNGASPNPSYEQPVKSCGENVQLFDKDNADTLNAYFSSVGTITSTSNVKTLYISCNPNETYTISKIASSRFRVLTTDVLPALGVSGAGFISNDTGTSITITTSSNAKYLCVFYYNGATDTLTEEEIRNSIKIEKGTQATPWSPYGMGCVNEKVQSRNIINFDELDWYPIKTSDGTVDTGQQGVHSGYIKIEKNKDYILRNTEIVSGVYYYISYYDQHKNYLRSSDSKWVSNTIEINSEDETYIVISWRYISPNDVRQKLKPQLEPGTQASPYVPHEEQNISIPTQQPMRSIGEVEDEFVKKSDGKWYERHWIYRKIFDGTENLGIESTSSTSNTLFVAYGLLSDNAKATGAPNSYFVLCNYLKKVTQNIWGGYYIGIDIYNKNVLICVSNSLATTTTDLKSWLAEQYANGTPVYADYILAEPTDILCTQAQSDILDSLTEDTITYRGGTYITSPDEVKARIKVSGLKDLNSLQTDINNVKQAIVALGGVV